MLCQFTCSINAQYTGHSVRRVVKRIAEHLPDFLLKGMPKTIYNAMLQHLVDSGHQIDPGTAFKTVLATSGINAEGIRKRFPMTGESIAIGLLNLLPWTRRLTR